MYIPGRASSEFLICSPFILRDRSFSPFLFILFVPTFDGIYLVQIDRTFFVELRYEIYLDGGVNHYAKRTTSRVVIPFMAKFIEYRILELNTPPRTALPGKCRANREQ